MEELAPFTECEGGRHDQRGSLIEPADQREQEGAAVAGEGEIAELLEDDGVEQQESAGQVAGPALSLLLIAARARALAKGVLPVPGPPTRTRLCCSSLNCAVAKARRRASSTGDSASSKVSRSRGTGNLAEPLG
jgi:hypothetical protein